MSKLSLLVKSKLTRSEIEALFKMMSFTEDYPAELQFQIAVPHDWGVVPVIPSIPDAQNPIVMLGKLKPRSSHKADITVFSAFLPHEIHPADWLESWGKTQSYTVYDSRMAETGFGLVSDLVATRVVDNQPYICRLTAIKDADRIVLLVARVATSSLNEFSTFQETFLMAVQTLKLLNPTKQKLAEAFNWVTFELPETLRFLAPHSWQQEKISDVPDGGEGVVFKHTLEDVVLGSIFVLGALKALDENLDIETTLVAKIEANNFAVQVGSYTILSERELANDLTLVMSQRQLVKDEKNYILTTAHYETDGISIVLMLLSPHKETYFDAWAINRRAFEIMVSTMEFSVTLK